jgi:hypothetical protein
MNHQGSGLIGRIAMWAVMILGTLFTIMIWLGKDFGISAGLMLTYVAMGVATAVTLIFALFGLNRKSLIGIGAFAVVVAIAYVVADGATKPEWNIASSTSKWIGAGIGMALLGIAGAVATILYGEVTRMFK